MEIAGLLEFSQKVVQHPLGHDMSQWMRHSLWLAWESEPRQAIVYLHKGQGREPCRGGLWSFNSSEEL